MIKLCFRLGIIKRFIQQFHFFCAFSPLFDILFGQNTIIEGISLLFIILYYLPLYLVYLSLKLCLVLFVNLIVENVFVELSVSLV